MRHATVKVGKVPTVVTNVVGWLEWVGRVDGSRWRRPDHTPKRPLVSLGGFPRPSHTSSLSAVQGSGVRTSRRPADSGRPKTAPGPGPATASSLGTASTSRRAGQVAPTRRGRRPAARRNGKGPESQTLTSHDHPRIKCRLSASVSSLHYVGSASTDSFMCLRP